MGSTSSRLHARLERLEVRLDRLEARLDRAEERDEKKTMALEYRLERIMMTLKAPNQDRDTMTARPFHQSEL